jgi:propanol-preferring alcohol dehydrogenase
MKAMLLTRLCRVDAEPAPLTLSDVPEPVPQPHDILLRVNTCGVCHTELDEIEGRTPPPTLPVVPGHQVVGRVVQNGRLAARFAPGSRVGVAWIFSACGACARCLAGEENTCDLFRATGRDADGGYAEYMTVAEDFATPIPDAFSDEEAAPLLCAGAVGYRSLRLTRLADGDRLGLTGFGASAHLVLKMARHRFPKSDVFVFARSDRERAFARELGATWAGETANRSPILLDAIIDTTPAWEPIVEALANLAPGGRLVINAIRKEDADKPVLSRLDYARHLWNEKEIKSVANVTRRDVADFLDLAATMRLKPDTQTYALADANVALRELKYGQIRGAKVLHIS